MSVRRTIRVGDKVKYSAEWLRSVGMYSGDMCFVRGKVYAIITYGSGSSLRRIAKIQWDFADMPEKVNVANLTRIKVDGTLCEQP